MNINTSPDVSKELEIEVLEILDEPVCVGEPSKDSVTAYWKIKVLWCDIDANHFLFGLQDPGESDDRHIATITIEEISPTYIKKGNYKRSIPLPGKIIFSRVA